MFEQEKTDLRVPFCSHFIFSQSNRDRFLVDTLPRPNPSTNAPKHKFTNDGGSFARSYSNARGGPCCSECLVVRSQRIGLVNSSSHCVPLYLRLLWYGHVSSARIKHPPARARCLLGMNALRLTISGRRSPHALSPSNRNKRLPDAIIWIYCRANQRAASFRVEDPWCKVRAT